MIFFPANGHPWTSQCPLRDPIPPALGITKVGPEAGTSASCMACWKEVSSVHFWTRDFADFRQFQPETELKFPGIRGPEMLQKIAQVLLGSKYVKMLYRIQESVSSCSFLLPWSPLATFRKTWTMLSKESLFVCIQTLPLSRNPAPPQKKSKRTNFPVKVG